MIAADVATLLTAAGLADYRPDTVGGTTYVQAMPDTDDTAELTIGVFLDAGESPPVADDFLRPYLQVRVRGSRDPQAAWAACEAIRYHLHTQPGFDAADATVRVLAIDAETAAPINLGTDARGRHEYTAGFRITATRKEKENP